MDGSGKVKDLKDDDALGEAMKSRTPTVIFMYMEGCPHCTTMWPIIKKLADKHSDTEFKRIESDDVGENKPADLSGFPHYVMVGKGPMKSFGGSMEAGALEEKLFGISKFGGRSARRFRRIRKSAHGSSRRNKTLRSKFRATSKRRR